MFFVESNNLFELFLPVILDEPAGVFDVGSVLIEVVVGGLGVTVAGEPAGRVTPTGDEMPRLDLFNRKRSPRSNAPVIPFPSFLGCARIPPTSLEQSVSPLDQLFAL